MAMLHPMCIDVKRFGEPDYKEKMFCEEHSTLGNCELFNRLYDDACDVGIALKNWDTGAVTRWYLHQEVKDAEGEIGVWIYHPCPESLRKYPRLADWSVHILND